MTERRQRKTPLRVPADARPALMYRRGDRLRDVAGVPWVVLSSERVSGVETVELETIGGGLRRSIDAARLADWSRSW